MNIKSKLKKITVSDRSDMQSILDSIRRIVRGLRISSRAAEKELGLSGAQLFVLQKLNNDHALSINELAERTFTHQSSVSVVVSRLVHQGLVTRVQSKKDARRTELELTYRGRNILSQAPPTVQENLLSAIGKMTMPQRQQLAEMLTFVVKEAGLVMESPPLFFEDEKARQKSGRRR